MKKISYQRWKNQCCYCYCLVVSDSLYASGSLVLHHLMEFAQTHVHCVSDAIQPSHPLSPLSSMHPVLDEKSVAFPKVMICIHKRHMEGGGGGVLKKIKNCLKLWQERIKKRCLINNEAAFTRGRTVQEGIGRGNSIYYLEKRLS